MKKSFLNLRNVGLVLVAAGSMALYSCGGDEAAAEAEATEMVEGLMDNLEEAVEEGVDNAEETMECGAGKCGDGMDSTAAEGEHACEDGKCGDGAAAEGEHTCEDGKCGE